MRHTRRILAVIVLMSVQAGLGAGEPNPAAVADIFMPRNTTGDTLLFSFYSLEQPQLSEVKDRGASAIGPYYGKKDLAATLARVNVAGLPVIYRAGPKIDFEGDAWDAEARTSALDLLKAEISQASQHPDIIAWSLATEELRHWRPAEMEWLQLTTETIRANDPLKRPIFMYEPNHRSAAGLVKTSKYLDFVAKGSYVNYAEMKGSRTWLKWSMEQAVAAAEQTGAMPLGLLWMAGDQEAADVASIRDWTRHDVYLSLISGAKGILVWSGWNKRAGFRKHYADFLDGYLSAAYELNIAPGLAKVFLHGKPRANVAAEVIAGPATQQFSYKDKDYEYPTLGYQQLELDGQRYLFLVNSANEPCTVRLTGMPKNVEILNGFSNQTVSMSPQQELTMRAYEVAALKWRLTTDSIEPSS